MAVQIIKKDLTIKKLIERLWANPSDGLVTTGVALALAGCTLKQTPGTLSVCLKGGQDLQQISVSSSALSMAFKGDLSIAVKTAIQFKISELLHNSEKTLTDSVTIAVYSGDGLEFLQQVFEAAFSGPTYNKVKAIKKLRELTHWSLKKSKDKVDQWEVSEQWTSDYEEEEQMQTIEVDTKISLADFINYANTGDTVVQLMNATKLHQPTKGTSQSSRYYVIAMSDSVKVSARIRDNNDLSIRAICTVSTTKDIKAAKAGFIAAGLDYKSDGGHWSIHIHPNNFLMVQRTIGSTLFAMGAPFHAVSSNLKALVGK